MKKVGDSPVQTAENPQHLILCMILWRKKKKKKSRLQYDTNSKLDTQSLILLLPCHSPKTFSKRIMRMMKPSSATDEKLP